MSGALVLSLFLTGSPASAQSALLDALSNRVSLTHPEGLPDEVVAERIIRSGDTVATDETGRAVVTYPDGSTALLEENSALTIEFVQTGAGDYVVRMRQTLGRVWYAVTTALTLGSRYEVRSPAMASVIRAGSNSYVAVSPNGETTVVTISGSVDTTAGGADVSVPAGSTLTISGSGAAPRPVSSPVVAQAASPTPNAPSPRTPAPTPARAAAPSPKDAFIPPVTTLPLPVTPATPRPKGSPTIPIPTPKLAAAPTPAPTRVNDSDLNDDSQEQRPPTTRELD